MHLMVRATKQEIVAHLFATLISSIKAQSVPSIITCNALKEPIIVAILLYMSLSSIFIRMQKKCESLQFCSSSDIHSDSGGTCSFFIGLCVSNFSNKIYI